MKVAVTGGRGFIGSAVMRRLESAGYEALPIDHADGVDVRSPEAAALIKEADHCIHLAGVLGTHELFDSPEEAVEINVLGSLAVLKACEAGNTSYVSATMVNVWQNVYQATKRCATDLATAWHIHRGVPVSHVRSMNAFGPGQKVGIPKKILPTFAVAAWKGEPVPVWGDGEQTVDLVYVDDVARMLVDAMKYGDDEVFDAGTGMEITVNAVAWTVVSLAGSKAGIEHFPMRPGENEHTHIRAAGEGWDLLGWKPEFRWEDLQRTVEWYRRYA